jgi:hypothetical protein
MDFMPDCFGSQQYGLLDVPDDKEYLTFMQEFVTYLMVVNFSV